MVFGLMFQILRGLLWTEVFTKMKLWEFLQVNVEKAVEQFKKVLQAGERLKSASMFLESLSLVFCWVDGKLDVFGICR